MIIKGNRHNNGGKLASYMTNGDTRKGERAELYQLRGFGEAEHIAEAFRDLEIMAEATKAENALFHVQIRLPEHERLTPEQWERAADRTEKRLGLTGQPRAITFHIDDRTGERHMHVGWSLIDAETMKAKPLPYFKFRLKDLARELEKEFDITRVKNERDGPILYAATKNEQQQAQRLGVDKDAIRNMIRACWERSDCGRSFDDALANEGFILAQGTRRDYVVIDHAGGLHALGKRVLDVSAAQVRTRLSDLDRDAVPTIEQAREFMLDLPRDRAHRLTRELADVQGQIRVEQEYARRDPVRDEIQWQDALHAAAIAKEERVREFVEPGDRDKEIRAEREWKGPGNRKEKDRQVEAREAEQWQQQGTDDKRDRQGHEVSPAANGYEDFFALGTVNTAKAEAKRRQQRERTQTPAQAPQGRTRASSDPGDVWMGQGGGYDALSPAMKAKAEKAFDQWKNHGKGRNTSYEIDDYVAYTQKKWAERPPDSREAGADKTQARFLKSIGPQIDLFPAARVIKSAIRVIDKVPVRFAGKVLDVLADAAGSLLAPPVLTPEQKFEAEKTASRREAEAEATLDYSRFTADAAVERRQQEIDREAERQRGGAGRER